MINRNLQTIEDTGKVLAALKRGTPVTCPVVMLDGDARSVMHLDGRRERFGWASGNLSETLSARMTGSRISRGTEPETANLSDSPYPKSSHKQQLA